jgi:hypothetical protein
VHVRDADAWRSPAAKQATRASSPLGVVFGASVGLPRRDLATARWRTDAEGSCFAKPADPMRIVVSRDWRARDASTDLGTVESIPDARV